MRVRQAAKLVDKVSEAFQFYLLKASNNLAKEKKVNVYGLKRLNIVTVRLPIDTYKKELDEVVSRKYTYDWEY